MTSNRDVPVLRFVNEATDATMLPCFSFTRCRYRFRAAEGSRSALRSS